MAITDWYGESMERHSFVMCQTSDPDSNLKVNTDIASIKGQATSLAYPVQKATFWYAVG